MEYCWKILVLLLAVIIYAPLVSTTDPPANVTQSSSISAETPLLNLSGALQGKNSSDETISTPEGTITSAGITTQNSTSSQNPTGSQETSSSQQPTSTQETTSTTQELTTIQQPTATQEPTTIQQPTATQEPTTTQQPTSKPESTTTLKPTVTPETTATGTTVGTNSFTTVIITSASTAGSSNGSAATLPTSTSSSTAADSVSSVATTLAPPSPLLGVVVISETNLLLTNDSSRYFVEIQVTEDVNLTSIWLVIHNAGVNTTEPLLLNYNMVINSSSFYVYTIETVFNDTLKDIESVLIALYADEDSANRLATEGLLDILLYSTSGSIDLGLKEKFSKIMNQNLVIDYKKLNITVPVSLSRCSRNGTANNVAVLTPESRLFSNACELKEKSPLEMKLTQKTQPCSLNPPSSFQNNLVNYVISDLNKREQCGLAASMLAGMDVKSKCSGDNKELDVSFTVISAFPSQVALIKNGYIDLLRQPKLNIEGDEYNVSSCYENCFNGTITPTSGDDDRMRVTIAVVVSCIGVFLLVLLFVVLYLRRKRKGILQFHMTRLDEDDDLAGDMDDFVGNQGPTFRSYR